MICTCHVREQRSNRYSSAKPGAGGPWTLDEVYAYGRDVSRLDLVAITDHDVKLSPKEWSDTVVASEQQTCPGEFIAFLGYESFGRNRRNAVNTQIFVLHFENLPTLHLKDEVELGDPERTEICL